MNSTTLRGVFPEQKPVYKKNFIKENMKYIKQIQGLALNNNASDGPSKIVNDKFRNVPPKVTSQFNAAVTKSKYRLSQPSLEDKPVSNTRITHRGIQTERNEDLNKLYECGVIKYPSPSVLDHITHTRRRNIKVNQDHGDTERSLPEDKLNALRLEDKPDYIKQNIEAVKLRSNRQDSQLSPGTLPPTYQKGVVPKYLKERKDEQLKDVPDDDECPDGHVLLPEEERRETLRVLRQSYADRIQELNSMPVRNDTLRMRKRKMELEEELKKIDEGIKVFQRPKVFVKINA
ncbi:hypothetical protein MML48_8g00004978 [Holotrichia oblita]|uniref:Uncharacterized protein n=1 Tax=Holotrichia oblita TaxID=644536 RepID=A0ACB9SP56_HOLOL|nr:hypothetical protein MML48_8g00004978 [Holotrichia oblita]